MLKIIGLVAMILDHIGTVLFPEVVWLRIIGRIAMPIYCYCIAMGLKNTKDPKKYAIAIIITAFVAQIPYFMVLGDKLNILFGFAMSITLIKVIDQCKTNIMKILAGILLMLYVIVFNVEYGFLCPALVMIFYYVEFDKKLSMTLSFLVISTYAMMIGAPVQLCALIALPLMRLYKYRLHINKKVFYAAYPVHLILIALVARFI